MTWHRTATSLCMLLGLGAGATAACSQAPDDAPPGVGGHGGEQDAEASSVTVGVGGACVSQCSVDGHDVVDCHGDLLEDCGPGRACAGATCMPACDAAAESKSSVGCSFYAHVPNHTRGQGCHAMFVTNVWDAPTTLTGEVNGTTIDLGPYAYVPSSQDGEVSYEPLPNGTLEAGHMAVLFLRDADPSLSEFLRHPCPMPAASSDANATPWSDPIDLTNADAAALRISTDVPVVAHDMNPFGGGDAYIAGAELMLPESTWDTNYILITPRPHLEGQGAPPAISIVASQDETSVTIVPTVDIKPRGTVAGANANEPVTYSLDRGQVLRLEQRDDLLGSVLSSDKPVGVWGEQMCATIGSPHCDVVYEQLPPIRALGHEYVYVRYRDRVEGTHETPPVRLTGVVDGTTLTWDPAPPPGAPMTLGRGESVEVLGGSPFVVRSQDDEHPFYVASYMTGGDDFALRGDPEFMNVIPPAQFMESYRFFTDPSFPETNLVFIRRQVDGAFADVTLDCRGVLDGWQPIGTTGEYEFTRVDLSRGLFEGQDGCRNGENAAHSEAPFGLTVWGWGNAETQAANMPPSTSVSYGYPAGARVAPITPVQVPAVPK